MQVGARFPSRPRPVEMLDVRLGPALPEGHAPAPRGWSMPGAVDLRSFVLSNVDPAVPWAAPTWALLDVAGDRHAGEDLRAGCLLALLDRGAHELPALLAAGLDALRPEDGLGWRGHLLYVAERAQVTDPDLRSEIQKQLLGQAQLLAKDPREGAQPALWTALRCYAILVPQERAVDLLAFLTEQHAPRTRIAALQGIRLIFSREPPGAMDALGEVQLRVREQALQQLRAPLQPLGAAQAIEAALAAAATGDPRFPEIVTALLQAGSSSVLRQVLLGLRQMSRGWASFPRDRQQPLAALAVLEEQIKDIEKQLATLAPRTR